MARREDPDMDAQPARTLSGHWSGRPTRARHWPRPSGWSRGTTTCGSTSGSG